MSTAFRIAALPVDELERIRANGVDDFGNPLEPVDVTGPGTPLRCCLRDAEPGERPGGGSHRVVNR